MSLLNYGFLACSIVVAGSWTSTAWLSMEILVPGHGAALMPDPAYTLWTSRLDDELAKCKVQLESFHHRRPTIFRESSQYVWQDMEVLDSESDAWAASWMAALSHQICRLVRPRASRWRAPTCERHLLLIARRHVRAMHQHTLTHRDRQLCRWHCLPTRCPCKM
jgi:hypothetical protein